MPTCCKGITVTIGEGCVDPDPTPNPGYIGAPVSPAVNVGSVTIGNLDNKTAGPFTPGIYEIHYASGFWQRTDGLVVPPVATVYWSGGDNAGYAGLGLYSPLTNHGFPEYPALVQTSFSTTVDFLNGLSECAPGDVATATLAINPVLGNIVHLGGNINFQTRDFSIGTGGGLVNNNVCGGNNADSGSASGSVTYTIKRVWDFNSVSTRLRISNFTQFKLDVVTCVDCFADGSAEWDGTFPYRDLSNTTTCQYYPDLTFGADPKAFSGTKVYDLGGVNLFYSAGSGDFGGWILEIVCQTGPFANKAIWRGYKVVGGAASALSPAGIYHKVDAGSPVPAFLRTCCSPTPECCIVEVY